MFGIRASQHAVLPASLDMQTMQRIERGSPETSSFSPSFWKPLDMNQADLAVWQPPCKRFFPKSISEMLGFSFRSLPRGARFERSLRVTGAGAAEMAWEEATEGERGVSGRWELLGLELQKWHGKRLRRGSEVWAVAESYWGWSCRNGMGKGYGGGARFERSLGVTGAGAAEMAWGEATEGERGLSGRWELLGLELQKWHGKRLRRGSEVWAVAGSYWGWSCRNGMGRGYGGGARFERSLGVTGAGAAEMAWEEATEGERGLSGRWELLGLELQKWHGKRLRRGSEVWAVAESYWGWSCRNGMGRGYGGGARFERSLRVTGAGNGMGRGYGGGARFERSLRVTGAGAAEMAWEEATEGERGLRGGWSCRNGMGRGYGGGARFERSLRVTGAGAAEMAWEEATEGERGLSGRWELLGLELQKWHGKRLRRGSEVWAVAESYWGWSCRNGMGRGYGGGARFERSLSATGAGAAEMAWEEATEGERGLSGRWELLGLELQKWHGTRLRRGARFERSLRVTGAGAAEMAWEEATEGSEVWGDAEPRWGWSCRNGMGGGYGGGARFEWTLRVAGAGAAEMAWEEAMEGERGLSVRWESLGLEMRK